MKFNLKQLKKMKVETVSGMELGKVFDIVFDAETQLVVQYEARLSFLTTKKYLINRDQVIQFKEDKMIVDDAVVRESVEQDVLAQRGAGVDMEPVAMRKQ